MKIQDILTDESKWTRGTSARDANGNRVEVNSPLATSYCLMGACIKAYSGDNRREKRIKIYEQIEALTHVAAVEAYNDAPTTTFADIRALIEKLDI